MQPIRVLTSQLGLLTEIDNYESLIFTRRWHRPGEFTLRINRHKQGTEYLQKGNIVMLSPAKAGIIRHREIELGPEGKGSEQIMIIGHTLQSIAGQRVVVPPEGQSHDVKSGPAETVMKHYASNCMINPTNPARKIPIVVLATDQGRGPSISWQSRYKNLAEELEKVSLVTGLGWNICLDLTTKEWVFEVYQGRNLTAGQAENPPVIFSPDFDNIETQKYVESDIGYNTTAYVGGQGEGEGREIVEVGYEKEGLDRREMFVDARDTTGEKLASRGEQKLSETPEVKTFEARTLTNSVFVYEKDWDIGDIVTVQSREWGVTADMQVTEVKEIYEPGGLKVEPVFGKNLPTLGEKIKQATDMPIIETGGGGGTVTWEDIEGAPTALPADGGNADTLDGKHASDFAYRTVKQASVPEAGWYRIAQITSASGRGDAIVSIHTTGGNYTPYTCIIKYHRAWSTMGASLIVEAMTSVGYWDAVRLTQDGDPVGYFLEVYFKRALDPVFIVSMPSLGYDANRELFEGELPAGGGTVRGEISGLVVGINTTGQIKAVGGVV